MHFELPAPGMTFDRRARRRRPRSACAVTAIRMVSGFCSTHGNGFAADAYYPYWQYLLQKFDLLVFRTFRQSRPEPAVVPSHHTYEQLTRDLERVVQEVKSRLGARPTAGLFSFDVGPHGDEACHRDRLALGTRSSCSIRPMCRARTSAYAAMAAFEKKLTEWARQRRRRFARIEELARGIPPVARHGALGRRRA